MKVKTVSVQLDESTYKWLAALAQANSNTQLNPGKVNVAQLLAQAGFCFADYAGRRPGSWESACGASLLIPSGYQDKIRADKQTRLQNWEAERSRR